MEIDQIHKYVSMTPVGNSVGVSISGMPALVVSGVMESGYMWSASPVMCKLVTGSAYNTPYCYASFETLEEAIADGISALHSIGVMQNEYDFDESKYDEAIDSVVAECRSIAKEELGKTSLFEINEYANALFDELMSEMAGPASKHDLSDTIDRANHNIASGRKPHHDMAPSEHAVLARSIIRAKAHEKEHEGNPTPPVPKYKGAEHHQALLQLGGYEHKKGRPAGSTVAAKIAKEKEKTTAKASLGVWGGLMR
jgi:hypothetical protein